jgi:hypothetical protein
MKKFHFITIAFLILSLIGCTDLEENPVGVLAPEGFFNSEVEVEAALYGAQGLMASGTFYGRSYPMIIGFLGDMIDIGHPGQAAQNRDLNNFTVNPTNGRLRNYWTKSYMIIGAANSAIYGAESLDNIDENRRKELIGEGKFIRSLIYFGLVRVFGDIPYIDKAITDPGSVSTISKTKVSAVYDNIISDLNYATENLPTAHPADARNRASKGSAYTLLADVYLTLGNYTEAYAKAKWVIDNAADLKYDLEPDFQNLFDATKQDGSKEPIYTIDFIGQQYGSDQTNDDLLPPLTGVRGTATNHWGVMVPSQAVYDNWDSRDYRKKVSIDDTLSINGVLTPYISFPSLQRPHIAKYTRFPGISDANGRRSDFNYALYRYSEVLLIAAEALNETNGGPNDEAIGYINQVRARARNWAGTATGFPADLALGMSKDDFLKAVLEERRLEFAFEFKRWFDIKRRDLGDEVFKGVNSLEPHDNFNTTYYLMPIPQTELDINPNLLPQNPGY